MLGVRPNRRYLGGTPTACARITALASLTRIALVALLVLVALFVLESAAHAQKPFSHAEHVDDRWLTVVEKEVWRDCNGCHQLQPGEGRKRDWAEDIGTTCLQCHQDGVAPTFDSLTAPTPRDPERRLYFFHGDHAWGTSYPVGGKTRSLTCRDCHAPTESKVPDLIPRPEPSRDFCLKCHSDPTGKRFDADFIDSLNHGIDRSDPTQVQFRHDRPEHQDDCRHCHSGMESAAGGDFAEYMVDIDACQKCHADDNMKITTADYTKPSATRNTFIHERHLQPVALDRHPKLGDCRFCHLDDQAGSFTLRPEFTQKAGPGEKGPVACRACHEEWSPPNHGKVGTCLMCHDLDRGALVSWSDLAERRGRLETRRPRASRFATLTHRHSFLGENADQECSTCHVAALSEQPSRFAGRKFEHWPHLSETPTKEECVACHGSAVVRSTNLKFLAVSHEGEVPLNYDKQACASCHPGRDPQPDFNEARVREVIDFNHSRHADFDCKECHEVPRAPDSDGDLGLPTRIGGCTKCHGHRDPEQVKNSYGITIEQIEGCKNCHLASEGLPVPGREVLGRRKRITNIEGAPGRTHHPDDPCQDCHVGRKPREQRMASNKDIENPHKTTNIPQSNVPGGVLCVDCHWGKTDLPRRRRTGWTNEPYGKLTFEYEVRDGYGDQREVGTEKRPYPGYRFKRRP